MSRPQFRHQFIIFDTAVDNHSVLPLTLDQAWDDLSRNDRPLFSAADRLRSRRSEKSICLPAAPPSTRNSSFEIFDYTSHDKTRGGSISSNGSAPSMVEDHSGMSDSDVGLAAERDSYEESMGRVWDTYETLLVQKEPSDAIMFHKANLPECSTKFQWPMPPYSSETRLPHNVSHIQSRVKSPYPREPQADQCSFIPVPTHNEYRIGEAPRRCLETFEGQSFDALPVTQATSLRRSHVPRTARRAHSTLKSLPTTPPKRAGCSLQPSGSKRSRSQPPIHPLPQRQHSAYRDLPYHARPVTNPCNSSHAYSIHNTPPLPMVEKSVFDYDTEDESHRDPVTQLSASIASKMHIRSLSLGSKLGLNGKRGDGRYEGTGRRRSATEIFMGVFGLGKK